MAGTSGQAGQCMTNRFANCQALSTNTRRVASRISGLALRAERSNSKVYRPKEISKFEDRIIFRCTPELRQKLNDAAVASGLTLCDVVRRRLSGIHVPARGNIVLTQELRVLRQELVRQGGLIKHLYNEKQFEPELTRAAWNKQIEVLDNITNLIIRVEGAVLNDREDGGKT